MASVSRIRQSFKNSTVALALFTVNLILQFYSRKIFLDYLGAEVLGLNTTASNLLQFFKSRGTGNQFGCRIHLVPAISLR